MTRVRFDIYSFGFQTDEDEDGMLKSAKSINQLITRETESGIEPGRIVLGGFSQGATMSLLTGLSGERKLAGLAILSGWLPMQKKFHEVCINCFPDRLSRLMSALTDGIGTCKIYSHFLGSWFS